MLRKYRLFLILLVLSVVSTGTLVLNRVSTEMNDRYIDFVIDYYEMEKLAEQSDQDIAWWLEEIGKKGPSSVGINYETIRSMAQERDGIFHDIVLKVKESSDWEQKYPEELVDYLKGEDSSNYDLLVTIERGEIYDFIADNLKQKYGEKIKKFAYDDYGHLIIEGTVSDVLYAQTRFLVDEKGNRIQLQDEIVDSKLADLYIGLDRDKVDIIEGAGLDVLPRIASNTDGWNTEEYIESMIEDYMSIENISRYIIFGGNDVLGYSEDDKTLRDIRELIKSKNLEIGIIETDVQRAHLEQDGIDELMEYFDHRVVKVFSIAPYIQERYKYYNYEGSEEIENTIYRAVTERNIKLVYFRPFKSDAREYVTDEVEYDRMFTSLEARLKKHGISYGEAVPMNSNTVNPILGLLSALGTVLAGVILLNSFIKIGKKLALTIIGLGFIFILTSILVLGDLGYMLLAITTAVVFPSLSMVYLLESLKKIYFKKEKNLKKYIEYGARDLLVTSAISLVGALIIGAIMSDIKNLLDINYFQGVKISQLIPIVIYLISFLSYFGYKREKSLKDNRPNLLDFKEVMVDNMKIFYAIIIALLAGVGYVYLARTGHETNIQPSNLEMIFRNIMENRLLARPRTKEILIAFPAVIMAIYMTRIKFKLGIFIMGLLAIVGQTSIVNTFTHFKTPIYMSFVRTIYGLIIGILVGIVYTVILHMLVKFWEKTKGET